jgi:hypothetical protein
MSHQHAGDERAPDKWQQAGHPRVRGRCPSCGSESLFLGSNGYVTCAVLGCKDPGAATDLLAAESQLSQAEASLKDRERQIDVLRDMHKANAIEIGRLEASLTVLRENLGKLLDACIVDGITQNLQMCVVCEYEWYRESAFGTPDHFPDCIVKKLRNLLLAPPESRTDRSQGAEKP